MLLVSVQKCSWFSTWNPVPLSKFTYSGNLSGDSVGFSVCTVSSIYSIIIYVCNEFFVSFPVLTLLSLVGTPSTMPGSRADSGSLLFPCFKRKASTYPVLKEVLFYFAKSLCVCLCLITLPNHARGNSLWSCGRDSSLHCRQDPWSGTKIPQATQLGTKKKKKKIHAQILNFITFTCLLRKLSHLFC